MHKSSPSSLLDAINHNLVNLETFKSDSVENGVVGVDSNEHREAIISSIESIPYKTYTCWIPNNSGLLRWDRIAVNEFKGRLSFNASKFSDEESSYNNIECIDTDLGIEDDLPTIFQSTRDSYKAIREDGFAAFFNNGFSPRTVPVMYTSIKFVDLDSGEIVKTGEGHKIINGGYKGMSSLCYFSKGTYNKLISKGLLNIGSSFLSKLNRIYNSSDSISKKQERYTNLYSELHKFLRENPPLWSFEVEYIVEARGEVTIKPLKLNLNTMSSFRSEGLRSDEGYKHIAQLIYGQIKKVYHGDNHHHHKDDVILQVYEKNGDNSPILSQMASHLKGLEKIEQIRDSIECSDYIPFYIYEAKGIQSYAEMYNCNYMQVLEDGQIKDGAKRFIKAINSLLISIEGNVKRYTEIQDRKKQANTSNSIFSKTPTWIFLTAFTTLMFTLSPEKHMLISSSFPLFYTQMVDSIVQEPYIVLALALFVIYFIKKEFINYKLCVRNKLHTDFRPKDSYMSRKLNTIGKTNKYKLYKYMFVLLFSSYLFYLL